MLCATLLSLLGLAAQAGSATPPPQAKAAPDPNAPAALWQAWLEACAAAGGSAYATEDVADGRILLVYPKRHGAGRDRHEIERTCKLFDALVPPPAEPPEHPVPAVLVDLEDQEDLGSAARFLGTRFPYLADWAERAGEGVGFVLEHPLVAAWVRTVPGVDKEWRPENELVDRLAQLLLEQRHGREPQWITIGLAWCIELEVCRDIYCFPYRAGFVGKREHKGWTEALAGIAAARGERPFSIDDLAGWPRGVYDDERAAVAWGAATLLVRYYPEALPQVLQELAELRVRDGRVTHPDGSWEAIDGYEVPAPKQLEVLDRALGFEFLPELARFAVQGRSYVHRR